MFNSPLMHRVHADKPNEFVAVVKSFFANMNEATSS